MNLLLIGVVLALVAWAAYLLLQPGQSAYEERKSADTDEGFF